MTTKIDRHAARRLAKLALQSAPIGRQPKPRTTRGRRPFDSIASPQRMRSAHAPKPCKSDIQIRIDYFRSA
ncbi:hypothetical protein [Burkholderia sp. KBS0801]|uniref:hypothetical protein n=1 Tax=Burkholderia sp. KBS0801 TaxID=1179675 RepID=UPI00110E5175|nr:hypothetical protein [Burkholderia sp. KBS0801]QDW53294.1 hypothetical protein FFI87_023995 [Burkholderia sp. KBS0801]